MRKTQGYQRAMQQVLRDEKELSTDIWVIRSIKLEGRNMPTEENELNLCKDIHIELFTSFLPAITKSQMSCLLRTASKVVHKSRGNNFGSTL